MDTGAPMSFGTGFAGVPGVDAGSPEALPNGLTIEWLREHIGEPLDGLIGADVLRTRTLIIDPSERTLELSEAIIEPGQGVPIRDMANVPILEGAVRGEVHPIIFDTGAPLGFVPARLVQGLQPVDHVREFYPLLGPFETDVYELPLEIGGESLELRFGIFPAAIAELHEQAGLTVLIGLGLLQRYRISVGLREQRMRLEAQS